MYYTYILLFYSIINILHSFPFCLQETEKDCMFHMNFDC